MSGTLSDRLLGKARIGLDTAVIIYYIQRHPDFSPLVDEVFNLVAQKRAVAVTSYVTLLEVPVKPLKEGKHDLVKQYRDILTNSSDIELIPVGEDVAVSAAKLRAMYHGLRAPDAIQLAAAMHQGADVFVTNDKKHKDLAGIDVVYLGDFIGSA